MSDQPTITVDVNDQVAIDILGAIEFPLEFNIPGDRKSLQLEGQIPIGEAEIISVERIVDGEAEDQSEIHEIGELFEQAILGALSELERGLLNTDEISGSELALISKIANLQQDGALTLKAANAGTLDEIGEALSAVVNKKFFEFSVLWAQLRIVDRPKVDLGNPIRVLDLSTRSRAKAEGCIKVFGKRYCARVTSPWIRVDGQEAALNLITSGTVVSARPRFKNLDFVITIKILRWRFKIKIGLTTLVNRYFDRLPPAEIADLSAFEQPIPFSSSQTKLKGISISTVEGGLRLTAETEVV
ncbi:hypothetical protein BC777_2080 [Yoonia maricola]|uniref:Uncharacterized protein n=1 Tax=Yoonia maricola TaxID=420999 RepID=A0A2M8WQK0_9RHOB|nr:hypothetical protein [Yoonia maricola]PJI93209.1 hypothetical protein BC777_2080 [Yoonia maricola]